MFFLSSCRTELGGRRRGWRWLEQRVHWERWWRGAQTEGPVCGQHQGLTVFDLIWMNSSSIITDPCYMTHCCVQSLLFMQYFVVYFYCVLVSCIWWKLFPYVSGSHWMTERDSPVLDFIFRVYIKHALNKVYIKQISILKFAAKLNFTEFYLTLFV